MSACCRYSGAGAVWDIWPCDAAPTLRAYLAEHCTEFVHDGKPLEPGDVQDWISSQARSERSRLTDTRLQCKSVLKFLCFYILQQMKQASLVVHVTHWSNTCECLCCC